MLIKICSKCKVELPATSEFFTKNSSKKDGFQSYCKACHKEYCKDNREKVIEHKRKYRENNADKRTEYNKANVDKKAAYDKKYVKANVEFIYKRNSQYQKDHPEQQRAINHRRKAKKKSLIRDFTIKQWESCLEYFDYKDAYTGLLMNTPSQDHVIPLSKGGEYTMNNIIPCDKGINSSKGNRDMLTWFRKQEYYDKEREEKILSYIFMDGKS